MVQSISVYHLQHEDKETEFRLFLNRLDFDRRCNLAIGSTQQGRTVFLIQAAALSNDVRIPAPETAERLCPSLRGRTLVPLRRSVGTCRTGRLPKDGEEPPVLNSQIFRIPLVEYARILIGQTPFRGIANYFALAGAAEGINYLTDRPLLVPYYEPTRSTPRSSSYCQSIMQAHPAEVRLEITRRRTPSSAVRFARMAFERVSKIDALNPGDSLLRDSLVLSSWARGLPVFEVAIRLSPRILTAFQFDVRFLVFEEDREPSPFRVAVAKQAPKDLDTVGKLPWLYTQAELSAVLESLLLPPAPLPDSGA
ncbi:MAG: hypothetical protein WBY44_34100 [Bryobacteraceae bacterium]